MRATISVQRCPATRIVRIEDKQIKETARCELPIGHGEAHDAAGQRWRFVEGSYSGLSEDHPDYGETIQVPRDRSAAPEDEEEEVPL